MFLALIPVVTFSSSHFTRPSTAHLAVQEMDFRTPQTWTEIVATLTSLERQINEAQNTPPR